MGVELKDWVATIRKYPLRFKFEGLEGFHTDVVEAAKNDRRFREAAYVRASASMDRSITEDKDPDDRRRYATFLSYRVTAAHWADGTPYIKADQIEEAPQDIVDQVIEAYHTENWLYEHIREELDFCFRDDWCPGDEAELLKDHPIEKVWYEPSGEGVCAEDVVFICWDCHRCPATLETLRWSGGRFYCSLCGAEYLTAALLTQDLKSVDEAAFAEFCRESGVEPWPLKK